MELSQLASKQKRARDWQRFIDGGGCPDKGIAAQTQDLLVEFRATLSQAAFEGAVSKEIEAKIVDLERRLEQLNEEARMTAA